MEKKKILYLVLIMFSYVNALGQYTDGESYNFCTLNGEPYNPGRHGYSEDYSIESNRWVVTINDYTKS